MYRGEGLVVKKLDCTYSTNSRGADWVKVKPEYAIIPVVYLS
jgi:DNA ligase-4